MCKPCRLYEVRTMWTCTVRTMWTVWTVWTMLMIWITWSVWTMWTMWAIIWTVQTIRIKQTIIMETSRHVNQRTVNHVSQVNYLMRCQFSIHSWNYLDSRIQYSYTPPHACDSSTADNVMNTTLFKFLLKSWIFEHMWAANHAYGIYLCVNVVLLHVCVCVCVCVLCVCIRVLVFVL